MSSSVDLCPRIAVLVCTSSDVHLRPRALPHSRQAGFTVCRLNNFNEISKRDCSSHLSCFLSDVHLLFKPDMSANSEAEPLLIVKKLGHGYDWDWYLAEGEKDCLPSAIDVPSWQSDPEAEGMVKVITLREITMLQFMNAVTDKPDWTKKVFDEGIVQEWKQEAVTLDPEEPVESQMTDIMFNSCIDELRYFAEQHDAVPHSAVYVLPADVYKYDTAVSEETKTALQNAVRPLEEVPDRLKDWHPNSDDKVLDLAHPSLFPLVYGTSKILPLGARAATLDDCIERCGEGAVVQAPGAEAFEVPKSASSKFQWLPCEVDISGERPRILAYINNLHLQRHAELYKVIEDMIAAAIPLWTLTLAPLKEGSLANMSRRIPYNACTYDPDPENETEASERRRR
ncbi:hypothetical protein NMY22_g12856 [Coprinellus aureogranulatus]|nr:hypothetical protein NMY22_g12856 [Coprinellus aureogranulatus]